MPLLATVKISRSLVLPPPILDEKPTAITSCNYHLDHFGHAFEIKTSGGEYAHTACIGFGLERIVLSLLMKHGFEPEQWPSDVKETLGL